MKLCKAFSVFLAAILLIGSIPILQVSAATVSSVNDMDALFLSRSIAMENGGTMNYRLYIPADYDPQQAYPVVLFLHGAGERGDDNLKQLKAGIIEPFKQENNPIYGCIVIAPQCPVGKQWVNTSGWAQSVYSTDETPETEELKAVLKIVKEVQATYSTDPDRLYVTGLSMGGYGTWDLLTRHPALFAAAIPVCGGADPSKAERLLSIPIWTFHGLLDEKVPPEGTQQMAQALQTLGADAFLFTPLPDMDHYIWSTVYAREEIFFWLLSKTRQRQPAESESESESKTESESESETESASATETESTRLPESESLPQDPNPQTKSTPKDFLLAAGIVALIGAGASVTLQLFRRKRR